MVNAANSESQQNPYAQYFMEYPDKLKPLFEDDDPNEMYEPPFKKPSDLMVYFVDLEE